MTSDASAKATPMATPTTAQQHLDKLKGASSSSASGSKRIELETLTVELRKKLGNNWDKYQATIATFLVGRLSRGELSSVLSGMLKDSKTVRMHNQLLLANLANALRDGPGANQSKYSFGATSKKQVKRGVKQSTEYEKLKKDIMNLPIRERHRIKMITRDSGKQKMANSTITLTRQQLLPKIPCVSDKEKSLQGNTIEWTQDISHALNIPLSIETYSLPDPDQLRIRMQGISREHGITGQLDKSVSDIMYHGLEMYLKNIIETAIDTARYRKRKYTEMDLLPSEEPLQKQTKVILTNEDMVDTFSIQQYLVEPSGPLYRLNAVSLQDDEYIEPQTSIDELLGNKLLSKPLENSRGSLSTVTGSPVAQKTEVKEESANVEIAKEEANMGTRDELTLLIRDLLTGG